jgi:hypothetical protein
LHTGFSAANQFSEEAWPKIFQAAEKPRVYDFICYAVFLQFVVLSLVAGVSGKIKKTVLILSFAGSPFSHHRS